MDLRVRRCTIRLARHIHGHGRRRPRHRRVQWQESLPDDFVSGSDQAATVAELLQDVPLPDGFDTTWLNDGTTNSRYEFITHVSGAVTSALARPMVHRSRDRRPDDPAGCCSSARHLPRLGDAHRDRQPGVDGRAWCGSTPTPSTVAKVSSPEAGPQPPSREEANSALELRDLTGPRPRGRPAGDTNHGALPKSGCPRKSGLADAFNRRFGGAPEAPI